MYPSEYLEQAARLPLLGKTHEYQLITRAQSNDCQALELLILHNEGLVRKLATRYFYKSTCGDSELDDLVQWGRMGMMKAIEKFDIKREFRLSTYATFWIMQSISRNGAKTGWGIHIPYSQLEKAGRIRKAYANSEDTGQRPLTPDQIAAYLEIDVENVNAVNSLGTLSLDTPLEQEDAPGLSTDIVDYETNVEEAAIEKLIDLRGKIIYAMEVLSPIYRRVIIARFGLDGQAPMRTTDIARELKLSGTRIQQIRKSATETIAKRFSEKGWTFAELSS